MGQTTHLLWPYSFVSFYSIRLRFNDATRRQLRYPSLPSINEGLPSLDRPFEKSRQGPAAPVCGRNPNQLPPRRWYCHVKSSSDLPFVQLLSVEDSTHHQLLGFDPAMVSYQGPCRKLRSASAQGAWPSLHRRGFQSTYASPAPAQQPTSAQRGGSLAQHAASFLSDVIRSSEQAAGPSRTPNDPSARRTR